MLNIYRIGFVGSWLGGVMLLKAKTEKEARTDAQAIINNDKGLKEDQKQILFIETCRTRLLEYDNGDY